MCKRENGNNIGGFRMKDKRVVVILGIILIVTIIGFSFITKTVIASSSNRQDQKLVTSIKLEKGDTLWKIANQYKTDEYKSIIEYINEIKRCNNIDSDTIVEGQYIIVPYYARRIKTE